MHDTYKNADFSSGGAIVKYKLKIPDSFPKKKEKKLTTNVDALISI